TRVVAVFVSVIVEVELTGTVTTVEKSAVEVVVCGGSVKVEVSVIDTVAVEVGRVAVTGTVDVISERVACVFGGRVTVSPLLPLMLLFLQNIHPGCTSHYSHHHGHYSHYHTFYQTTTLTCLQTVTQPTITQTVPVTDFATVTNTARTYTLVTPTPVMLTEMSTLTLSSTVLTITPSTTITSTGTNIVTSTPPLVSTVTSSTSTILFSTTIVVQQTITITSTSTIISTRTSRLPMCVKDASETEHYYAEDVEYTCTVMSTWRSEAFNDKR
uniref:Uncharacterized protein n=1 Tax=Anopheles quadriannulatus TaxID=34691 RepID=A0A182X8N5_ANOQN